MTDEKDFDRVSDPAIGLQVGKYQSPTPMIQQDSQGKGRDSQAIPEWDLTMGPKPTGRDPGVDYWHPAFRAMQAIMDAKADDYSGGRGEDPARKNYHPYGDTSYLHMLHLKMERIKSIAHKKETGQTINFEGLKDSVGDLINYAAFYWAFLEEEERAKDGNTTTA